MSKKMKTVNMTSKKTKKMIMVKKTVNRTSKKTKKMIKEKNMRNKKIPNLIQ